MKREINFEEFKKILSRGLDIDISKIDRNTLLVDELEVDSLSIINFVIMLEEEFDIEIDLDEVKLLKSVNDIYNVFLKSLECSEERSSSELK